MMKKNYWNRHIFHIVGTLVLISILGTGCNAGSNVAPANEVEAEIAAPTEEVLPTATLEPTVEPTLIPTEIPTPVPTDTPVPELGLIDDGIGFWTIPLDSGVITVSTLGTAEDYSNSNQGFMEADVMNIQVPGNYIVAEVHFNQALPSGTKLQILELGAVTPWYEGTFKVDANDGNSGVLLMDHRYLINPPFWEITYHAKIVDATGKVFWENDLRIFKALPNTCWDGSLPDPVTLYCKNYDGDWNYRDFPNFNPYADMFTSGQWELDDDYY